MILYHVVTLTHTYILNWIHEFPISSACHFITNPMVAGNKLNVLSHPLINAELSRLRDKSTSPKEFREVYPFSTSSLRMREIGALSVCGVDQCILGIWGIEDFGGGELWISRLSVRCLSITWWTVYKETPVGPFVGNKIKPRIGLTPILRAGIGMTEALVSLFLRVYLHPETKILT